MQQDSLPRDIKTFALEVATDAAYEAGKFLISQRGNAQILYKKSTRDNLLDVHLQAEVIILEKLRKNFPSFGIFSEETARENENAPYQWIVDPLDGSANFQHGSPLFAISIGLLLKKYPLLGVVYLPALDEMFTAIRNCGALLNGHPTFISDISTLNESIIHVGDFAKNGDLIENESRITTVTKLAKQVGRVRMIGTAATDLTYIACGRADALIQHSNHPWDIEAGRLIVMEAGGSAGIIQKELGKAVFIYSNGYIHQQLAKVISATNTSQPQT